jgi:DNA-binding XRE family transcriptional regulator
MTTTALVRPAVGQPYPITHSHSMPAPVRPSIGVVIRRLRHRRGLTQVTCAALIGYSETWLSQVERGARTVDSISALRELARVLDVDVRRLIEVVL